MSIFLDEIACIHGLADAEGLIPIQTFEQLVKSTLFVRENILNKVWSAKFVKKVSP